MSSPRASPRPGSPPELSGIVIHWRNEEQLRRLLDAWPHGDPRFELIVVDNSASLPELPSWVRRIEPRGNLGFAGGVNRGVAQAEGAIVLLLNPDVVPRPGALDEILAGLEAHPQAAGLVPRLLGVGAGTASEPASQHRWQLRPLPGPSTLILQTLLVPAGRGPATEPAAGSAVAQPAAAALALRRSVLEAQGGFDDGFYPAWFEDVDFARRLEERGEVLLYWPAAELFHELGASVPGLGYGPFLWVYYRNLQRYLAKHHGAGWRRLSSLTLLAGMAARLVLLPLKKPRRARRRREAAWGLLAVIAGALTGWRRPEELAERFSAGGGS